MAATVAASARRPMAQTTLPGVPESVSLARRFVRAALPGCPRVEDLALAATELASNAVRWSAAGQGGTFTVTVRTAPRWARVEVTDPGPAARPAAAGNGWGLGIVVAVTDRHDTRHGPGAARTSWAEASWPEPVTAPEPGRPEVNDHDTEEKESAAPCPITRMATTPPPPGCASRTGSTA
jgi:serine/threonine-protein kinase RsbW